MINSGAGAMVQTYKIEQFFDPLHSFSFRDPKVACINDQVSPDIQIRIEVVVLRHDADERSNPATVSSHIETFDRQITGRQRGVARNHAHSSRLARAIRPKQAEGLAAIYAEVDTVNGALISIKLGKVSSGNYRRQRSEVRGQRNLACPFGGSLIRCQLRVRFCS